MIQDKGSFITSFGDEIDFTPGYLDYIQKTIGLPVQPSPDYLNASINAAGGHENLDYVEVNKKLNYSRKKLSLSGYAARVARVYQFLDLLGNTQNEKKFVNHLDIGCGFGIQPRILRALGVVESTTGIDVYDRCTSLDEALLKKQHKRFRRLKRMEFFRNIFEKKDPHLRSNFTRAIIEKFLDPLSPRHRYKNQVGWMPDTDFYNLKFVQPPKLDRFIQGDVFKLDEKFDLITTFTSFEWFEAKSIFKHVSNILNEGGIFYIWVSNWWSDTNVTRLAGHFPFACQRMQKSDYFRYLDECLPENAEAMKVGYNWFDPSHPTLSDYIEIGYENGLIALDSREYSRPDPYGMHSGISPIGHVQLDGKVMDQVLTEIHRFNPNIRLSDLLPFSHAIVFKKINKNIKLDSNEIAKATESVNFLYEPKGPISNKIKEIGKKIHKNLMK